MIVSVFSTKGGVGKTSLSFSIAKDLGYDLITNDFSSAVMNYGHKTGKARFYKNNIPLRPNTLYDFGGFSSDEAYEIIEKSDLLIIPTIDDFNAMLKCIDTVKKFKHKDFIVVANAIEKPASVTNIKMIIDQYAKDARIISVPRTKMFKNALELAKSATDLYKENSVYDRGYKGYLEVLRAVKIKENSLVSTEAS